MVLAARRAVRVRVPAKVNLFLRVGRLRPDGYHELVTVLQTVDLHDELVGVLHGSAWASDHPAARKLMGLALEHDGGDAVPDDGRNLVLRAARALLDAVGAGSVPAAAASSDQRPRTVLRLAKRIPVAAGMAGGSADAAAALLALDRLWGTELEDDELHDLAAGIGADVPFCLTGGTAIATGTGTRTARVLARGEFHWVVAEHDGAGLPTPEVYREHDRLVAAGRLPGPRPEPDAVLAAVRDGDTDRLGAALHNDLQHAAVALRPELEDGLVRLRDAGALGAVVSGSGPTLLGLARDEAHARELAAEVAGAFRAVHTVCSDAGGPRLHELAPADLEVLAD